MSSKTSSDSDFSDFEQVEKPKRKWSSIKTSKSMACLMFFCFLGVATAQCGEGLFIPTTFQECVRKSSTEEVCNIRFQLTATIQHPMAKTCFVVSSSDGKNDTLITGEIRYDYMLDRISLASQYYTSSWRGVYQNKHRCAGAGYCSSDECSSVNTQQIRNAYGELTNTQVIRYPGKVRCTRRCGCAACGCFRCDDGCVFSGSAIVPTGSIYQVSAPVTRSLIPAASLSLFSSDLNLTRQAVFVANSAVVGNFSLRIVGSLQSPLQEFASKKIACTGTTCRLTDAANPNSPAPRVLGDIQGNTAASFTTASPGAFSYANGLWTIAEQDKADIYSYAPAGMNLMSTFPMFPMTLNGNLWSSRPGFIESNLTSPGALLITLETSSPITVTRIRDIVCPKAFLITASGCYNCTKGSTALITAESICRSGSALILSDDPEITITTNNIHLTTDEANFTISFKTKKEVNDFYLVVRGTEQDSRVRIQFRAVAEHIIIDNPDDNGDDKGEGAGSKKGNSFSNFFTKTIPEFFDDVIKGVAEWWEYIIFVLIIIAALAILFFFLIPAIKTIFTTTRNLKSSLSGYMKLAEKIRKE